MKEVLDYLAKNPVVYFATCDEENHPRVRPFQFLFEKNGKLWFCTNSGKKVFAQLKRCPYVEMSIMDKDGSWMRLWGKCVFDSDLSVKEAVLEHFPRIKNIYKTADNPVFEVFYLTEAQAGIFDFSGNPPRKFSL